MVLEIANYTAEPGKAEELQAGLLRGAEVIRRAKGCLSVTPRRQVEDRDKFILTIEWETLDDHLIVFRNSPEFAEYRSHINGLFTDIYALHYEVIGG